MVGCWLTFNISDDLGVFYNARKYHRSNILKFMFSNALNIKMVILHLITQVVINTDTSCLVLLHFGLGIKCNLWQFLFQYKIVAIAESCIFVDRVHTIEFNADN